MTEPFLYPHAESNRNHRNRNPVFYPLNYGGDAFPAEAKATKIGIFA